MSSNNTVPESLRALGINKLDIVSLYLVRKNLTSLPESIGLLKNLSAIYLEGNNLTSLPESIGNLKSLLSLRLEGNNLTSLPESIGNLENLYILGLKGNKLTSLPKSIGNLKSLLSLELSKNNLRSLPESIGLLKNLRAIYLEGNNLTSLPESIGRLTNLKEFNLRGNPNLKYINRSLYNIPSIKKNSSTKFIIPRKNVYLNKQNDKILHVNFKVGNNAVIFDGYNRYYFDNTILKLTKGLNTNLPNRFNTINDIYDSHPRTLLFKNPYTRENVLRSNLTFVKFVEPPPTNKNNKKPTTNKSKNNKEPPPTNKNNKKPTTNKSKNNKEPPPAKKQKTGNAAQSRRTSRNNNKR
jgi:Leucine-rich repeat (LRR) protein